MSLLAATALLLQPACAPDPQLSYVCGPEKPEDLVAIPGTRWLVASGFAPGAGLKLVDTRTRQWRSWYTAPAPGDRGGCTPLDPGLFNARGLSLRSTGRRRWELLVVNHGGRESIERFSVHLVDGTPQLRWTGCLPMPAGQVANSVAAFADGTILATVLTRPGTTIADFVQGRITGAVWQHRPGDPGFTLLPGTELPGNNGIEVDPDGRRFYVVAFGWHAVVVYDRRDTRAPLARIVAPDFMPDNIRWTGGKLLIAGMRLDEPACGGVRRVENGVADPMLCHRGWSVGAVDPDHRRVTTVAAGPPQPGFNGVSAAALVAGQLWLGSFQSARLAVVRATEGKDASR
ncbi:hypothetical protein SAMN06297144_0006 [Sphingomonas guangdongensis]|uniref:SMP-30/Gluconolaconase/LRE-like region-containing protein n=1 Tax=Sphingomonas guangdongensis TaxID=1141890 RepID=A0A285QEK9_9SPHN|nr:hypothetical protein [Sphingomonas guangdongensis]SOB78502.1 hypothetical protein SAMN06297144_0006 [Sphingomonas guangdongensis]